MWSKRERENDRDRDSERENDRDRDSERENDRDRDSEKQRQRLKYRAYIACIFGK